MKKSGFRYVRNDKNIVRDYLAFLMHSVQRGGKGGRDDRLVHEIIVNLIAGTFQFTEQCLWDIHEDDRGGIEQAIRYVCAYHSPWERLQPFFQAREQAGWTGIGADLREEDYPKPERY